MIKPISNITLKPLPKGKRGKISSLVEVDGVCYAEKLEGRFLEMAFSYDDCYILIFVTQDGGPWEETLFIYLLDSKNQNIIDSARIGGGAYAWLSACGLCNIKILSDHTVSFEFMSFEGTDGWLLKLFKNPIKTFPFTLRNLFHIWRPISFKRHFLIEVNKTSL
ncbi:hypothetical protein [Gilliamella sp. Pas-s95]|uniref:hypothetical protein n=1 Tax=Gilliamella sp. Pas-s95 TaxID=2687317 RepID=UPI00132739F1|nr:hypothetical protein [Gilliamella sp. Pas-s95]MWN04859.1 hypothetical protein [Gilliamella sp. Pas-s95]